MGDFPYVIRVFPVCHPTVRCGFFFHFSYLIDPTLLFEDNHGAICLTQHGHVKELSKHLDLRWKFIKDYIDTDVLKLVSIASEKHQSVTLPLQPNTLGKRKR